VLVAEDEDAVRAVTRRVLEDAGYTVLAASNGVEALEVSEAHAGPIHLVVTDVVMAKMGGPALAARLAHARPATRVLFISGHTDGSLGSQGVLDEGTNFLAKPFTPASLTSRVRSVLDSGRGPLPRR
jgi:CheY-like chemotaxis protein